MTNNLIALALGYLLGSIPFGLIFAALSGAGDVRKIGSGNIGATNVLRTGKKWAAAATLIFDAGKGALAIYLARHFFGDLASVIAGAGAFFGHLFPVWLKFKGGKGVATFFGIALMLNWMLGIAALLTWIVAALIWRISSLSALVAAILTPLYFLLWHQRLYSALMLFLAIMIFIMHRENIARLLRGEEPRIGAKK
ncbi:MAG TPA: glycerol-3-phosphate 1-O-acyltransferase PlsY [Rhizomicrobium sp.]|nr:glycerol-3-phosphate 1-O-acyltransferase PlsY [Rhizomicrobium sp.]